MTKPNKPPARTVQNKERERNPEGEAAAIQDFINGDYKFRGPWSQLAAFVTAFEHLGDSPEKAAEHAVQYLQDVKLAKEAIENPDG